MMNGMVRPNSERIDDSAELDALFQLAQARMERVREAERRVRDAERELAIARDLAVAIAAAVRIELATREATGLALPKSATTQLDTLERQLGLGAGGTRTNGAQAVTPVGKGDELLTRESDRRVLAFLQRNEGWWRVHDLAREAGINPNTARGAIGRLRRAGLVSAHPSGRGYTASSDGGDAV